MGKKILIIEDEETLSEVLANKLKKEGYEVECSFDGESGLEKIRILKPDLILLDIIMPKMTGYDVLEKMKDEGNKTPVIIISNSGQPVEIEKTKRLGALDHLIKTQFDAEEVVDKVNKCIKFSSGEEGKMDDSSVSEGKGKKSANPIKILLVEDDYFLRDILAKKLVKEGFFVYESVDGEQALKEVVKNKPDIVLLDVILPSQNGFEVLASIKNHQDEKIRNTIVIMLSNLGQEEDIQKALDMKADNFLIKSNFTTEEIVKKIKIILTNKK